MASKRNSRVYTDENTPREEGNKCLQSTISPHLSHRSSKDDLTRVSRDKDDTQAKSTPAKEAIGARLPNIMVVEAAIHGDGSRELLCGSMYEDHLAPNKMFTAAHVIAAPARPEAPNLGATQTGLPLNFGHVIPGVYRSSYPKPEDFAHLKSLNLKTIVSLVKKEETDHDLEDFSERNGIRQMVFNMKGTKKESIPEAMMSSILQVVLDQRQYPLLIHCNHGKHRTGCVVAAIRKTSGWNPQMAIDEYCAYASPKIRECDVDYIREFQVSPLPSQLGEPSRFSRAQLRNFSRILAFTAIVALVWLASGFRFASTQPPVL